MKKRISFAALLIAGVFFISSPAAFAVDTAIPARDLTIGSRGADVMWLQDYLISTNSTSTAAAQLRAADATGYFGVFTRAALADFQAMHSITPSQGYFGPKTRAMLAGMSTSTVASPTFSGTIEAVDTACFADGVCSVTVSGKKIVLEAGLRIPPIPPRGQLKGIDSIGDLEGAIGRTANVYAATTTEAGAQYTLYGNTAYYVEVLPAAPAASSITRTGTIGCLPPKDPSKPTILLCAFGLKADDGNYYSLSTASSSTDVSMFGDKKVEVKGMFTAREDQTWKSVGVIQVTSAKEVQ